MHSIVIIGAGFSGTLVAVHLLRRARGPLRIVLVERRQQQIAAGVAYGAAGPGHLLNVPAGAISALPEDPAHFLRWARRRHPGEGIGPGSFLPRRLYGAYLRELFNQALRNAPRGCQLELPIDEAVDLREEGGGLRVALAGGRVLRADQAVLALGNFPVASPVAPAGARRHPDPWAPAVLPALLASRRCLLVGSGLTMVDLALALTERGYTGTIEVVSRRGLLPASHAPGLPAKLPPPLPGAPTARGLLRQLRDSVAAGGDWRPCVDALRPHSQGLWAALPLVEQRRFLRHLRPYWDSLRHRLAPAPAERLGELIDSGRLRRHAGRIEALVADSDGVTVTLRRRGGGRTALWVEQVVDCTGPEGDYRRLDSPLLAGLLARGLARPGPLGIGLATDGRGALLDAAGQPSPLLYTLGPARRGSLGESVAVPELREQARQVALALLLAAGLDGGRRDAG